MGLLKSDKRKEMSEGNPSHNTAFKKFSKNNLEELRPPNDFPALPKNCVAPLVLLATNGLRPNEVELFNY
ncbi:MAG: hypothetical protein QF682_00145 [Candidatus Thermoplasmatota archaeon]|nr:hypothetical protein [Candidatus Thermoplasmatota archaeon]